MALSCSKDNGGQTDKTNMNLVTGLKCRQSPDDLDLQLGNPNVLVNNQFTVYPNPVNETLFIAAQDNITDVWVVPAHPEKIYQTINFGSVLNSGLYTETNIIAQSGFSLNGQSSNFASLNVGALSKGYYKVFVKIGGVLYWDNIYKYNNQESNESQFAAISSFWN